LRRMASYFVGTKLVLMTSGVTRKRLLSHRLYVTSVHFDLTTTRHISGLVGQRIVHLGRATAHEMTNKLEGVTERHAIEAIV
jgi:hypothetical protein